MNPYQASAITYPTGVYCGPFELPTFPLTELAFTGMVGVGGALLFGERIRGAGHPGDRVPPPERAPRLRRTRIRPG